MMPSDFEADSYDWDALARYLAGESTPAEQHAVQAWLDARPERAQLVDALRTSIESLAVDDALDVRADVGADVDVDVEGALRTVHARMVAAADAAPSAPPPPRRPRLQRLTPPSASRWAPARWRVAGSLAAAAAIALTIVGIWRSRAPRSASPATIAAATYTTSPGQRDSVRLSDGSMVILAPSSRLDVAAGYGVASREVALDGEAYFSVVHDAAKPFTVRSGGATIVDVGTTFIVRDDPGESVRVAVTSGAVRLRRAASTDTGVLLGAGDAATLVDAAPVSVARGSVTGDDTAFTRGALVLRDAPMAQVAAELRRWYGVDLRVSDSTIAHRHLTATFEGESPEQAMAIIGAALGARVERRGDTVFVR